MASSADEIDDSLYSRQRYMLGDKAMKKMAHSNVFLSGLGGLGIEIAKNIVLAGVKSLTVHDIKAAAWKDLGTQFFLKEADVQSGRNRAEASIAALAELNPNVAVKVITDDLFANSDLSFLSNYQCVILTETSLATQIKVNEFCRGKNPAIQFISGDVYGVFSYVFCDFGDNFEVADLDGEEARESFVATVSKANPGIVTCLDNRMHKFDDGDYITFKEVNGMDKLNGEIHQIKVVTPYAYSICDTSGDEYKPHTDGGIAKQVKVPVIKKFESLAQQILKPSTMMLDFLKDPMADHLAIVALLNFQDKHSRLPRIRDEGDAAELVSLAEEVNSSLVNKQNSLDTEAIKALAYTAQGCFSPLTAFLGGVIAQEILKAVTSKYTPLDQWVGSNVNVIGYFINLYHITITDNDLIEKSNLNRQFLFRPKHIQKPKSTTGAESAKSINSDLKIVAHQNKVCPETEKEFFNDKFFESMDLVVNALDNVEARRYMDSRCVANQRTLLESGTMGAKGHVQVIVANMTESYGSQQDPVDEDVPYCTLKSFPATIEHTIQWARDKFASFFSIKPTTFNKFWIENGNAVTVLQKLEAGEQPEGVIQVVKFLGYRPTNWNECIATGRKKFEKYFNHKARTLLHIFPRDSLLQDGTPFWQSPKRPPTPQVFDETNDLHTSFVISVARLCAFISNIPVSGQDLEHTNVISIIRSVQVPEFIPKSKTIIVPAIATTTAAVSGLVTLELVKVVKAAPIEHYKNCFMNLGLPLIMFSEPGQAMATQIKPGLKFTCWDRWTVKGNKDFTLQDFANHFKSLYNLDLSMLVHGVRMVYVPIMPGHMKRLPQTMLSLLKPASGDEYFDLVVGFEPPNEDDEEDLTAPPVRYYFGV
ncbi:ubiquitin-like modifier-activating enzyme 6 [Anneissia japonica]|uniref:ubiquitin-like modifier-activating enzyme 6 n=1 Tax=Anneissia japonica TaxID=1529436 RepID=UPI00142552C6|nr:ubiquitin-like modifier-activating enzyme 6 [Anneissia japonica]